MTYEKTIDIDCFNDEQAVELTEDLLESPAEEYDPSDDLYEEYREKKLEKEKQFVLENKDLYLNQ